MADETKNTNSSNVPKSDENKGSIKAGRDIKESYSPRNELDTSKPPQGDGTSKKDDK